MPRAADAVTRCTLVLLGLCLLLSAAPCVDIDIDGGCDLCDQDDLVAGPAAPLPEGSALLLEPLDWPCFTAPAPLAFQFPHPPEF